jgi:hypothetical protein
MSRIIHKIRSLLATCPHDGLTTPILGFRGGEIWRCERCGSRLVFSDPYDAPR